MKIEGQERFLWVAGSVLGLAAVGWVLRRAIVSSAWYESKLHHGKTESRRSYRHKNGRHATFRQPRMPVTS